MYVRECVIHPELPKCKIRNRRKVDGVSNTYSFGPGAKSSVIGSSDGGDGDSFSGSAPNVDRDFVPTGLGEMLPDTNTLGNNDFSRAPPPAASYAGRGTGNPGGGGGGAPGSVSPPGKGGAASGGGGGGGASGSSGGTKVSYDGSGGGWKGYGSGGRGGKSGRSSGKTRNNPFAKLFGKNKKKSGSEVMDFRSPASKFGISGSIFKRLSRRYGDVVKNKRLHEYTTEEKSD